LEEGDVHPIRFDYSSSPSQYPVDLWLKRIEEPTLANAILDRLVHNAYTISHKGDSMRKRLKV
jgi:DNA replication protein DnaC